MPKKKNKEATITFQYKAVDLVSANISMPQQIVSEVFNFTINLGHSINKDQRFIFVLVHIVIEIKDCENPVAEFKISNGFSIDNFIDIVQSDDKGRMEIETGVLELLNSLSISTSRGVVSSFVRGTWLHNAVLPVINPRDFTPLPKEVPEVK